MLNRPTFGGHITLGVTLSILSYAHGVSIANIMGGYYPQLRTPGHSLRTFEANSFRNRNPHHPRPLEKRHNLFSFYEWPHRTAY